ncbi:MAG: GFA family protein [Caulobacteraceae bacterium]
MEKTAKVRTGGCLCGALRFEAEGEPIFAGHCYCADCRKASGSGFIPFMGFSSAAVRFTGPTLQFTSKAANGGDAVRNSCPACGSLVFGGVVDQDEVFTVYAGALDDPSTFHPKVAIFTRGRPAWASIPPELTVFETTPD